MINEIEERDARLAELDTKLAELTKLAHQVCLSREAIRSYTGSSHMVYLDTFNRISVLQMWLEKNK